MAKMKTPAMERIEKRRARSCLVYTSQDTDHLIGAEVFEKMKPDAILVCTARGKIVDCLLYTSRCV